MPNLFIRQPFSESGKEESAVIQSVIDLIQAKLTTRPDINILTDTQAQTADSFVARFEEITGSAFSPATFRQYRLSLLDRADAIIHIRTGLSESSAFEMAYNIFKGNNAPILFCIWNKAPIKTTLLQGLEDVCPVRYAGFERAADLDAPLEQFIQSIK